jgi:hypothetical protein
MHTIIISSIIAIAALIVFRFSSRGELLFFFTFLVSTAFVLVSLIVIEEYKLAAIPAAFLSAAVLRMWQAYKGFED